MPHACAARRHRWLAAAARRRRRSACTLVHARGLLQSMTCSPGVSARWRRRELPRREKGLQSQLRGARRCVPGVARAGGLRCPLLSSSHLRPPCPASSASTKSQSQEQQQQTRLAPQAGKAVPARPAGQRASSPPALPVALSVGRRRSGRGPWQAVQLRAGAGGGGGGRQGRAHLADCCSRCCLATPGAESENARLLSSRKGARGQYVGARGFG